MSNLLYSVVGNDPTLTEEKLEEITNEFKDKNADIIPLDFEDSSLASLLEEVNMIPFLSDFKVVVVKNPNFLYFPKNYNSKLMEEFFKFLIHPVPSTSLILVISDLKKVDGEVKKYLESYTKIIEVVTFDLGDLHEYVKKKLAVDSFTIMPRALDEFLLRTNQDVTLINTEIQKIETYKDCDKVIKEEDICLLVSKNLEDNVFDLINSVIEKNKKKSIDIYNDLMVLNEDESKIISMLISKFNEIYQTRNLLDHGYTKNDIAGIMKVKPGRAFYMVKNASSVSLKEVKNKINYLVELDYQIKSGQIDKSLALESFLLR